MYPLGKWGSAPSVMKSVLHVPDNWKKGWRSGIEAVKQDQEFSRHHAEYCRLCDKHGSHEEVFYEPLMKIANRVFEVLAQSELINNSGIPQRYHVSNTKVLRGGVMSKAGLRPDLVVLHEGCKSNAPHWANPLHILEVKPYDNAICTGEALARLVVDGKPATKYSRTPRHD